MPQLVILHIPMVLPVLVVTHHKMIPLGVLTTVVVVYESRGL